MSTRRNAWVDAGLALLAVVLFVTVRQMTGRIPVNDGRGWDGMDYAAMLTSGFDAGSANSALRPFVVGLTMPAQWLLDSPVAAFRLMNLLFAAVLGLGVCWLFARYNSARGGRTLLIVNLFLCIATAKYAAFYPVLVDMGAMAVIVLAMAAIVSGQRLVAALALVGAVTAREFGLAAVVFLVARDLRQGAPFRLTVATASPAVAALVVLRLLVTRTFADDGAPLSLARLATNLQLWGDPVFSGLFVYFALTVFGGISLFTAGAAPAVLRLWRREWEWVVYTALIGAAAAAGDADIWRYLAYLLPAVVAAAAAASREIATTPRLIAAGALVTAATLVTQRPWQRIDLTAYFRDWFPYYIHTGGAPIEAAPSLWPLWTWRFAVAAAFLVAMAAVAWPSPVSGPSGRERL